MNQLTWTTSGSRRVAFGLAVLVAGLVAATGTAPRLAADDRNLFRAEASAPYIFVLFDATGSMADNLA